MEADIRIYFEEQSLFTFPVHVLKLNIPDIRIVRVVKEQRSLRRISMLRVFPGNMAVVGGKQREQVCYSRK